MALVKSRTAQGITPVPSAGCAGAVVVQRAKFVNATGLAANDIIELAVLPAYHYLVSARLVVNGITTGNVGILTGRAGDDTNPDGTARTLGANLYEDGALNDAAFGIEPVDYDRGIGVVASALAAAGTGSAELILTYAQG